MERADFDIHVLNVTGAKAIPPVLRISWATGGASGGNCWGDEASYFSNSEDEPEFEELDKLLLLVAPSITFLQYKLISKLISTEETTEYEYYGNYTEYKTKEIKINDLWNALKEMKLV